MRLPTRAPAGDTRKSLEISRLTLSSPVNRQASRALRRRPAGIRPGPPRVGEREFAVRHPQPPQRGVDARHRQREGDATARGGEGARPFHSSRFLDRRLFFKRGPRLGAARRRRDPGAVHPETARTRPGSRRSRATRGDGRVRPRDRRRGGVPCDLPSPSSPFSALRRHETTPGWVLLGKIAIDSESRFYGNASWHVPRALFFLERRRLDAKARTPLTDPTPS